MKKKKIILASLSLALMLGILFTSLFLPNQTTANASTDRYFHGIYIGDRDTIEAYFLELIIPRTDFSVSDKSPRNHRDNAPWSGHRRNRGYRYLTVLLSFPDIVIGDRIPYLLANLWLRVPSGNERWNWDYPRYQIYPMGLTLSLSHNFFVYLRHNNIPDISFSIFNLIIIYNNNGFGALTMDFFPQNKRRMYFSANARTFAEDVYTGVVDPTSPYFDINFGNTGNVLGNRPDEEINTVFPDNGCQTMRSILIGIAVVSVIVLFIWLAPILIPILKVLAIPFISLGKVVNKAVNKKKGDDNL